MFNALNSPAADCESFGAIDSLLPREEGQDNCWYHCKLNSGDG